MYKRDYKQIPRSKHTFKWSDHPLYRTWNNIKSRCYFENDTSYKNYGARGIQVCDEWLFDFEQFVKDMGDKPTPQYSIERIDNDGNYCKDNCKWVTAKEQGSNKRVYKTSKTGISGIRLTSAGTYQVRTKSSREILGCFATLDEAISAQRDNVKQGKPRVTNTTGVRGVTFNHDKYQVRKVVDGKRVYLGACDTLDEARKLYESGEKKPRTSSKTGFTGINFKDGKYIVRKTVNGKRLYLGAFKTINEARRVYDEN